MADLSDVYGQTFQNDSSQSRIDYIINNLANNIAHRQFKFRVHDTNELWNKAQDLQSQHIDLLISKVNNINKKIVMQHLDKQSGKLNMLPELIVDTPVEYFLIIDSDFGRAYFIYITPTEVNSY